MNSLLVEPFGGLAGDMFLAGLIDLGLDLEALETALRRLPLPDWQLVVTRKTSSGISGTHLRFVVPSEHSHRGLSQILAIIDHADFEPRIVHRAGLIFRHLAEAEGKVHGIPWEDVHFHEVGAMDSILDIVGVVLALQMLDVEDIWVGPLPYGHGSILCEHGEIPNPAPATGELLKGWPQIARDCPSEMVTPTGAAIVSALGRPTPVPGLTRAIAIGYGAGTKDFTFPNVCRMSLLEPATAFREGREQLMMLETYIDDMNPEFLADTLERIRLLEDVLDVVTLAAVGKKGRLGQLVQVLCRTTVRELVEDQLLTHTSSLGVRGYFVDRRSTGRRISQVETRHGTVNVKFADRPDGTKKASVEFEDIRRIAHARPDLTLEQVKSDTLHELERSDESLLDDTP